MREAEVAGIIQDAIDYILLIRDSSGADNGEHDLYARCKGAPGK